MTMIRFDLTEEESALVLHATALLLATSRRLQAKEVDQVEILYRLLQTQAHEQSFDLQAYISQKIADA